MKCNCKETDTLSNECVSTNPSKTTASLSLSTSPFPLKNLSLPFSVAKPFVVINFVNLQNAVELIYSVIGNQTVANNTAQLNKIHIKNYIPKDEISFIYLSTLEPIQNQQNEVKILKTFSNFLKITKMWVNYV